MTKKTPRSLMIELLGGDSSVLEALEEAGMVAAEHLTPAEVENVLVARTLIQELEVNLPGVEVILRLRSELIQTRTQMTRLAEVLSHTHDTPSEPDED